MWNIQTREMVKKLPSQNHWVRALVAEGNYLYSGSYQSVKVMALKISVLRLKQTIQFKLSVGNKYVSTQSSSVYGSPNC